MQSPSSAVAKALGAILSAHLDPAQLGLYVQQGCSRLHPCSCPARPCWRRPLEREPAGSGPRNAKSSDLGGGSNTLNTAMWAAARPIGPAGSIPRLRPAGTTGKAPNLHAAGKNALPSTTPPSSECARGGNEVAVVWGLRIYFKRLLGGLSFKSHMAAVCN